MVDLPFLHEVRLVCVCVCTAHGGEMQRRGDKGRDGVVVYLLSSLSHTHSHSSHSHSSHSHHHHHHHHRLPFCTTSRRDTSIANPTHAPVILWWLSTPISGCTICTRPRTRCSTPIPSSLTVSAAVPAVTPYDILQSTLPHYASPPPTPPTLFSSLTLDHLPSPPYPFFPSPRLNPPQTKMKPIPAHWSNHTSTRHPLCAIAVLQWTAGISPSWCRENPEPARPKQSRSS